MRRSIGLVCDVSCKLCWIYSLLGRRVKPQVNQQEESAFSAEVEQLTAKPILSGVAGLWLLLGVGVGLLMLGAHLTVKGASDSRGCGDGRRGLLDLLSSAGTGLPEVVASVMSAIRGRVDIAIGNVIGSNLFKPQFLGSAALSRLGSSGYLFGLLVDVGSDALTFSSLCEVI